MPKKVNVPNIGVVNFPDDMPMEQITLEINKMLAQVGAPAAPPVMPSALPDTQGGDMRDSFAGGVIRGLRDLPDAGAQMLTRGIEAISPENTAMERWAQEQVKMVEDINRGAEADYQQNWRNGQMAGNIDFGRITGQIPSSLVPATRAVQAANLASAPLRAAGTAGVVGGLSQPVTVPEQQGMTSSQYLARKAEQAGLGGATGMATGFLFDKLGRAITGARMPQAMPAQQGAQPQQGGAAGSITGGGSTLGQVGADASAALTEAQRAIMLRGRGMGFRTTPGQETGSKSLQQMEARMESNPFFSGPFNAIKDANQTVLNRSAAQAIGENTDELSAPVIARAADRIGQVFDNVGDDAVRVFDTSQATSRLAAVLDEAADVTTRPMTDNILVQRAMQYAQTGQATGTQLASLSSKLGKVARKEMTSAMGDRDLGQALFAVKELTDDLLMQNMDDVTKALFAQARQQYRNLMTLESKGVVNTSSGNVSGLNLASTLASKDKSGFVRNKNQTPMYDAARFAQAFRPIVGNSGTATRMMDVSPLSMALSLPSNLAAGAYTSGPSAALARAVTGPGLAGGALTEAQKRLLQQYLPLAGGIAGQKIMGQ